MNDLTPNARITPPPTPASLADTGLPLPLMRDILLKTMFRMSLTYVSDLARSLCLPFAQSQQLIDDARGERLIEAMGTLHANATSTDRVFLADHYDSTAVMYESDGATSVNLLGGFDVDEGPEDFAPLLALALRLEQALNTNTDVVNAIPEIDWLQVARTMANPGL